MELLNIGEHLRCFNYDHSERPQIEVRNYLQGEKVELSISTNKIIFFLKGGIRYSFHDYPECKISKGKFLFLPMGYKCTYYTESDTVALIFRLYNPIKLCESFFIERLFDLQDSGVDSRQNSIKVLDINPRMQQFINSLIDCISDGIKCKYYFDLKIREFFLMLRAYYPKNELREFLGMILSRDTAFSEYVRSNRNKYPTVAALAKSMNFSQKQFVTRFKRIFKRTPYDWMKEGKTITVLHEITTTKKSIKQVAIESGFTSVPQFTRYCRREFGKTPTDIRSDIS